MFRHTYVGRVNSTRYQARIDRHQDGASGVARKQAQLAILRGTSNPNLKLFIARQ
jgi:hypothetical protein